MTPEHTSRQTEEQPEGGTDIGPRPAPPAAPEPTPATPEDPGTASPRPNWGLVEALRFLLPLGHPRSAVGSAPSPNAVRWFVPIGLLIGIFWAGAFRAAWHGRVFGETGSMRIMPALTVVLLECLFTGPSLVLCLARTAQTHLAAGLARRARTLSGRRTPNIHEARPDTAPSRSRLCSEDRSAPLSPAGTLTLCLTVLSLWVLVLSIPHVSTWWPTDWRRFFNFIYPRVILRPLILAPLWGRWGILLAATIGKAAPNADPQTTAVSRSMGPARLLLHTVLPLFLTAIYCSREHNRLIGVVLGMLVFAATYIFSITIARRAGGQTRQSLFAAGQIAQLAFLAIYRAFWPIIHR